jgi:CheY-like chemotaxis protein
VEAQGTTRRRVVVADDDVLLRQGLASLLERSDFEVVGRAGDADEMLRLVREHRPDLVIVDIRMPPTHSTRRAGGRVRDPRRVPGGRHPRSFRTRRDRACDGASRYWAADRLFTQGPGHRRGRVHRVAASDRGRRIRHRSEPCADAAQGSSGPRPTLGPDVTRTRGAGPDGRGPLERRNRPSASGFRENGRETYPANPDEASVSPRRSTTIAGFSRSSRFENTKEAV